MITFAGLPLLLLVFRIRANHTNDSFSADDLAILTNPPDACTHFHGNSPLNPPNGLKSGELGMITQLND
jgi:hypothetical protein